MEIKELYRLYREKYLVDTDTRKIRKGTIFFALKGENFNGNKFAEEAIKKGASYAVIDEEEYATNEKIILVKNVLKTLQNLANYHRRELGIPIVCLTGSNGKTTTKEVINAVLSKKYSTNATLGNLNNHIGVPLTLLSMNPKTEVGIVEMGANHHGEIKLLSEISEPSLGYITNFGKAHLEGFGSVEGVIEAKSELYDFIIKSKGKVVVNQEDKIQMERSKGANQIFFDESVEFLSANPFVSLSYKDEVIQSNLLGQYNYNNIAAAITIGQYFNVQLDDIKEAIESYIPKNNRSQVIKRGSNEIILDAYNANPTSMKAALENFDKLSGENKVVILGDMFELGKDSGVEHQNIALLSESLHITKVILVGNNFNSVRTIAALKFKEFEDVKTYLQKNPMNETRILIKGSRGMALERCLDFIS
ncbi:UDP-N-acetylmuramoyl-tripeptide--D-alanyl-D-alanine ligase [Tenacibaculum sp. 190524A05c]|uniref:UDP-N-acetylmuramoyl-tripeptide--D-alanyl-D-alanine ligase n=1 Tax=Tenacibaculum platacis TaxID=3137852 RepID=A0ABM9P3X4_9FLAO